VRWKRRKNLIVALLAAALGCGSAVIAPRLILKQGVMEKEPRAIRGLIGLTEHPRGKVEVTRFGPAWDSYSGIVDVPDRSRVSLTADAWFEMFARGAAPPPSENWWKRSSVYARVVDYGWPWRCFDTVRIQHLPDLAVPAGPVQNLRGDPLVLGVGHIRWRPFSTNVAFFTAVWGVAIIGVSMLWLSLRRRSRRRAGRCLACGYNRTGLAGGADAVCPECGNPA